MLGSWLGSSLSTQMGFFEYVSPRGRGGGDGTIVFLGMGDDGSYGIERYD